MTLQNEKFEELISQQLASQLDPQRGRAAAAFRAQIAAAQAPATAGGAKDQPSWARRQVSRAGTLFWIAAPSALAAAFALAVTLHFTQAPTPVNMPPQDPAIATADSNHLEGTSPGESLVGVNNGGTLATATGIVQEQPGDVQILSRPAGYTGRPAIRTTAYVEPAYPYPLNAPHPQNKPQ